MSMVKSQTAFVDNQAGLPFLQVERHFGSEFNKKLNEKVIQVPILRSLITKHVRLLIFEQFFNLLFMKHMKKYILFHVI